VPVRLSASRLISDYVFALKNEKLQNVKADPHPLKKTQTIFTSSFAVTAHFFS